MIDWETRQLIYSCVVWGLLGVGVLAGVWWAVFTRGKAKRFCPGPKGGRWAWVWPLNWVKGCACGYELVNLPVADGVTRCPECGRDSRDGERRRSGRWISSRRVAVVMVVMAMMPPAAKWARGVHWAGYLPNAMLLNMREVLGTWTPRQVRGEIHSRLADFDSRTYSYVPNDRMSEDQKRWAARLFVKDLRDDDVSWNADEARSGLGVLPRGMTLPLLEEALGSDDYQQRQLAADIMHYREDYPEPSDAMLRVCVEGLQDDSYRMYEANGRAGMDYLSRHGERAEPFLVEGMASKDAQQRFLSALVVCQTRRERLADKAVPIMIEALADNGVYADATNATAALVAMGKPGLPMLRELARDEDDQRWVLAALIVRRIEHPDAPAVAIGPFDAARINSLAQDPTQVKLPVDGFPNFPRAVTGVTGPGLP